MGEDVDGTAREESPLSADGVRRLMGFAVGYLTKDLERQSDDAGGWVGGADGSGMGYFFEPGGAAERILLRADKASGRFFLKLAAQIPDSGYSVERRLVSGSQDDLLAYLREEGRVDALVAQALELDASVAERLGEYPLAGSAPGRADD